MSLPSARGANPAARAAAAPPLEPPAERVVRRAVDLVEGVGARGHLGDVRLADDDDSLGAHPRDMEVIGLGAEVREMPVPGSGGEADGARGVLDRNRKSVQSAPLVGGQGIEGLRLFPGGFNVEGDDGIDVGVVRGDALEMGLEELSRGNFS